MNKLVFIGIIALILGTAGVLIITGSDNQPSVAGANSPTPEEQAQMDAVLAQYTGSSGTYTDYDQLTLASTSEEEKNVLFFEGLTCPVCKELDKNLLASEIPDGVHIYNLIYEENPELVRKYNVRSTPTLIEVDSSGQVIKLLQPVISIENILLQLI